MPIYEYRCQSCGNEIEKLQRMDDPAPTNCPECGKPDLRRKISAAAFRLKGAGWYETDFKQGNKRNLADSPSDKSNDSKSTPASEKSDKKGSSGGTESKTTETSKNKPAASSTGDSA
jgi:putative FmdB family regulatory protein